MRHTQTFTESEADLPQISGYHHCADSFAVLMKSQTAADHAGFSGKADVKIVLRNSTFSPPHCYWSMLQQVVTVSQFKVRADTGLTRGVTLSLLGLACPSACWLCASSSASLASMGVMGRAGGVSTLPTSASL